jgi:hypothetical protein
MEEEMITISKHVYDHLLKTLDDSLLLECLRESGVNNWEGYSDAYQLYVQQKGEE